MTPENEADRRWVRLLELLTPLHDRAVATARRLCRSVDEGDDLFQEAVLRAYSRLSSLRDENRFRSWFYAVLLSVHRNRSRRAFWQRFFSLERKMEEGWNPVGVDGTAVENERLQAAGVSQALASLPAIQREAVVLFEMEGYSVEEIATFQDSSISAVKTRLSRGRERLRRWYEEVKQRDSEKFSVHKFDGPCHDGGIVAPEEGS